MAIFDSSFLGTAANRITFNGTTFPIFRVQSRRPQQRQMRDLDIPIPFESGISDFRTLEGRSFYIIEGTMYPGTPSDYDTGLAQLRKLASLDIAQADTASDDGYVPYVFTETSQQKQVFVKVLYVDIPESTRKGLVQPFRLVCKVKDPVIYGYPAKSTSTAGVDPTLLGGSAIFPFSFPIVYGASRYSVSQAAINNGDLPTYPLNITVTGPVTSPRITNLATGEFIFLGTTALNNSGNTLLIAYDKDSLSITLDGNSVLNDVSAQSTYFKLVPGPNIVSLSGSSVGSGATIITNYMDAWPLS